jgi:transposase-like protein
MSKRRRRANFTAEQKVAIPRERLLEAMPGSDLCDHRHGLQPSQFYTWQKQLFERVPAPTGRDRNVRRRRGAARTNHRSVARDSSSVTPPPARSTTPPHSATAGGAPP